MKWRTAEALYVIKSVHSYRRDVKYTSLTVHVLYSYIGNLLHTLKKVTKLKQLKTIAIEVQNYVKVFV